MMWRAFILGLIFVSGIPHSSSAQKVSDEVTYVAAAPGRLEGSSETVRIGTAANGLIKKVLVHEGSTVNIGDVLATIACEPTKQEWIAANAAVKERSAMLAKLQRGARPEEIAEAKAAVEQAKSLFKLLAERNARFNRLQSGRSISAARLSETRNELNARRAALNIIKARLLKLINGTREEDVSIMQHQLARARANVQKLQSELDLCLVKAPTAGTIVKKYITSGAQVSTYAPRSLFEIAPGVINRVRAEVDERDLHAVCKGQAATVSADGYPGRAIAAHVERLLPAMGRRTILSDDPAEKSDRDVREVIVKLAQPTRWPFGLRVVVRFQMCSRLETRLGQSN